MGEQTLMWLVNGLLAILFFVLTFSVNRLTKAIDELGSRDVALTALINEHREDLLRNYVRQEHLEPLKKDIIGRVDRLEAAFTRHSEEQDRRVLTALEALRLDLAKPR